ncbi:DnaA regulatory inactivator Hda [Marinobacterium rhizophilum]|uniref:DnaA regulatory inactivator Hda n=1 Tax=Marinobacterium rhizophilum TaxID=420402 RepID=A0ABY5HPT3_9GAMM|nr:DnaA regulatory inactivator Hda [Marinobacterium rhizophilum]UTW13563.1 DnaA regulatory inactivator Hda [Marinobacterium rhizophilum]
MNNTAPFQLPLGVSLRDDARFENYLTGANGLARAMLQQAAEGEGELLLYLWGTPGVGCTHLLQAACHASEPARRTAVYLPLQELLHLGPGILEGMEHLDLVCIDNIQLVAGKKPWEEGLFHFFNRIRAQNNRLVVAANSAPRQLGIKLPDLASRLSWGMVFQLHALPDEDKERALQLRAQARGFQLSSDVVRYLIHHSSRDMGDLFGLLERLDQASLSAKRKITIPFIKQEMGW